MSRLEIIVQATPKCIELLRELYKLVDSVNAAGFELKLEVADSARMKMLEKQSIQRLPVLIPPEGKIDVGTDKIIESIKKNIEQLNKPVQRPRERRASRSEGVSDVSVEDYLNKMAYDGVTRDKRGLIAPKDKEDMEDQFDYSRERKKYRTPKHYKNEDSSDSEEPPRNRNKRPSNQREQREQRDRREQRNQREQDEYDEDYNEEQAQPKESLAKYAVGSGSSVDDDMMAALLENM